MQSNPVQEWVNTLPTPKPTQNIYSPHTKSAKRFLSRDCSFHSDESQGSSLESVLEMRKPNPEEMLLELGFGPRNGEQNACRIPARFLQPSKLLPQIDFNKFLERYGAKLPEQRPTPVSSPKMRPRSN